MILMIYEVITPRSSFVKFDFIWVSYQGPSIYDVQMERGWGPNKDDAHGQGKWRLAEFLDVHKNNKCKNIIK